jgi:glycerophosphoryl diester phosphodiesterase
VRARRHGLHPFLDQPGPVAIAHRGGAEEAPENTLEAFGAAVALGYRYLETDAHVSRDGVVVAFHDPRLDNITERTGAIAAPSIAEIAEADAGYVFVRRAPCRRDRPARRLGTCRHRGVLGSPSSPHPRAQPRPGCTSMGPRAVAAARAAATLRLAAARRR